MESSPAFQGPPYVARPPQTIRLSAGVPTGNKVAVIVLATICLVILLPLLGLVSVAMPTGGGLTFASFLLGFASLALLLVLVWAFFRIFRGGAYLLGTELIVRGAFLSRRVDLATAQLLRMANATSGWTSTPRIPTLHVYGDAQGRSATVHFRCARAGFLPLPEVEALALAIRTGSRTGLAAEQAEHAIRELYLRAYTPHAPPFA